MEIFAPLRKHGSVKSNNNVKFVAAILIQIQLNNNNCTVTYRNIFLLPSIPFGFVLQQNEPKYIGNKSQIINNVLCSLHSFSAVIIFLIILNPICSLLLSIFVSLISTSYDGQ